MTTFHANFGGNSKFYFKSTSFFKVDFEIFSSFSRNRVRDNLTSASVKVVLLAVTSTQVSDALPVQVVPANDRLAD